MVGQKFDFDCFTKKKTLYLFGHSRIPMNLAVFVRLTVRPSVRNAKSQKAQQFCLILCMMLENYKFRKVTKHDF